MNSDSTSAPTPQAHLRQWRDGLITPAAVDPLFDLTLGAEDSVRILRPHGVELLAALDAGRVLRFQPAGEAGFDAEAITTSLSRADLVVTLGDLRRAELHLALGFRTWAGDDGERHTSPVLLVPVELVAGELPGLRRAAGDAVVNPVLGLDDQPYPELLAGGGTVDQAVLAHFPLAGRTVGRRLRDDETRIAAHPVIRALTTGSPGFGFPDEPLPPGVPLLLETDADQRAVVAAALAGRTFAVDGPPGTGKSQTVATMIGALLGAGRRVLFVSENTNALDAVRTRLHDAGLGPYLLDLHSRREVAAALGRALEHVPGETTAGVDDLPRQPLGLSLRQVTAMINDRGEVLAAPTADLDTSGLTADRLARLRDSAATLARNWRPAAEGRAFTWRGVTHRGPLDARLYAAAAALDALSGVAIPHTRLTGAFDIGRLRQVPDLARLLAVAAERPDNVPEHWLTTGAGLDEVRDAVDRLAADLRDLAGMQEQAGRAASAPWAGLPSTDVVPALSTAALDSLPVAPIRIGGLTSHQAASLAAYFEQDAEMLEAAARSLNGLAVMMGLPPVVSFADADSTLAVIDLAHAPERPERAWLSIDGHTAATRAMQALYAAVITLHEAEAAAELYFTPALLGTDVEGLAGRLTDDRGLKRFVPSYRADRRALADVTHDDVDPDTARENLHLALAWSRAAISLATAESRHAPALGAYYYGRSTDFDRINRALSVAAMAIQRARTPDLGTLANHIARDAGPDDVALAVAARTRTRMREWRARLAPEPNPAARPDLVRHPILDVAAWLRAHQEPLRTAATAATIASEATNRDLTVDEAYQLVGARATVDAAYEQLQTRAAEYGSVLGHLYRGEHTAVTAVGAAVDWALRMRTCLTGFDTPLTPAQADALQNVVPTPQFGQLVRQWDEARIELLAAFDPGRQADMRAELDDYAGAGALIAALRTDTTGQDEWFAYRAARADLDLDGVVDFCITERVPPAQLPRVVERAVLQAWADRQGPGDDGLSHSAAVARIIAACNALRPRDNLIEAAVIRREAAKTDDHLPVRLLLEHARNHAQALKPGVLASPAAAARHLPAGYTFDVVVFDEASRITPGAAAVVLQLATSAVVVGDREQLPPAVPGSASILDLMADSPAFRVLALHRHYRSRHRDLIAFANSSFYENRLVAVHSGEGP
ncbi:MAG TPA: AAA domain-containing protein, partial [Actinoplanes sp.]|nr:AAA domain-containing protein [Actinoplanes sp.]